MVAPTGRVAWVPLQRAAARMGGRAPAGRVSREHAVNSVVMTSVIACAASSLPYSGLATLAA